MTPKLKRVTVVSVLLLLVAIAVVVIPLVKYSNSINAHLYGVDDDPPGVLDILSRTYFSSSGLSSSGEAMNIESIGGWNVWWVLMLWLVGVNVVVYHLRQISKSLRILVDSQQKEQG